MKTKRPIRIRARFLAGASLALAGLAASLTPALAQSSFLWDGGDGSSLLWSTPGNWNPDGAPANLFSADFIFGGTINTGTAGTPLNNDLTTGTISNLTWSAGAGSFYLGGNTFTNRGNWTNLSGVAQSVSAGMVVGANAPGTTNTHFIDVGTGSLTLSGPISAPAGNSTMAKIGPGTLYLTSSLTNTLGNGTPGGPTGLWVPGFSADEGTIIFDGGPTSVYNVTGEATFGRNAPTGNRNVTAIMNSGKLASTTWMGIGRGNGAGDVFVSLTLNGSSVYAPVSWSGGYNSGDGNKKPWGAVVQNGTSVFQVFNNGVNNNFSESPGAFITHTLNDSSSLIVGGGTNTSNARARIGISGRQVIKQTSPTATVTFGQAHFGDAPGGSGAFYNRGIFNLMSAASTDHFSIGSATGNSNAPALNGYGYYLNDSATLVGLREIGVGGAGGGDGVLEVKQGTVNVTNWITVCRYGTASNVTQNAELLVRGGLVNAPNVEQFRYIWSSSATQYAVVDVNSAGKIGSVNGPNSAIDLAQSANANATSLLTVSGGGALEVGRIFAAQGAPLAIVNFNGCTLSPTKNINGFLGNNLDGVYVHSGGVTFDTKGFDITVNPQLQAPMDFGVTAIPVATPGGGYIGRPIVRITDPSGVGATAIAEWSEASGTVTGITITSPGSGYSSPTVALVGGGFTNAATLGTPPLGSAPSGGLTKTGAGTLTLTGGATYTGPTVITGGTLSLLPATIFPASPGSLTISNAALTLDMSSGSPLSAGAITFQHNTVLNLNYGTVFFNPFSAAIAGNSNFAAPGTNIVINISAFGLQVGQFPLISYAGSGPANLANFSLGVLPPGVVANLVNDTGAKTIYLNVTSTGQNLAWSGLLPDGLNVSSNWDITLTTNWVAVGTTFPALRYQEYTSAGVTVGDPVRFDDNLYNDFITPPATNVFLTTRLQPFSVTVDTTLPYSFNGPGRLSGLGNLVKTNSGTLTIGTSNDYTGGTILGGGTLVISNNAGLGAPAAGVTFAGGALQVMGSTSNTRPLTVSADSPLRVGAGLTAQFGGTVSGAARLISQDAGTAVFTNKTRLQFFVDNGTYIFDRTAQITNNTSYTSIGRVTGNNGTLIIRSNATFDMLGQDFNIADVNDARGTLYLQDNAVMRTRDLWVGKNDTCVGYVYQSGGVLTNADTGGSDWRIGGLDSGDAATFGSYNLSGGRLDAQKNFQVGAYGTGEMIITGGTWNQWAGYPAVGRFTNGVGTLTISGGQFNQFNTGTFLILGEQGTGTLNLSGTGVVTLTNALRLAHGGGGTGTANLNAGGRLITPGVIATGPGLAATLNFNGGTLQPTANNGNFLQGPLTNYILAGGGTVDTAGKDLTITLPLLTGGGGGGLTKAGAGTLTLSGANTYTGPTLVNAGRVFLTPAHLGGGSVTVADNAGFGLLRDAPSGVLTLGSLTLGTAGATTLGCSFGTNGNPTAFVLDAGTLAVNGTCSVSVAGRLTVGTFPLVKYTGAIGGSGSFNPVVTGPQGMVASLSNHVAGSTLYVTISSLGPGIVWTGTNSVAALTNLWDLNSTTNWTVNGSPTFYAEATPPGDAVRFDDTGSGLVRLSNSASPAGLLITNASKSYSFVGSGRLAGPSGLTKQGAATTTMSLAANDYLGDTLIQDGILQLGSATAVPDGAGRGNVVVSSGATLDLNGNSETINGLAGPGAVNNSSGTAATLTLGAGDASSTWSGTLNNTGSGGLALTKVGFGTSIISGTNYLNAGVQAGSQFNGGLVIITNNGVLDSTVGEIWLGQNATTGTVVVAGGTLKADNNWIAIGRNNAAARGTLIVNSGVVEKAGGANIVLGSLGGTGTIIVNGGQILNNGMLWLGEGATANGYLYLNGGLIQASQVRPNNNNGLPVESIAWFNGGTLQASGNSADFIQSTAWVQAGGLTLDSGGFDVTLATVPLQEDAASPGGGLTKTGAGRLQLNTANTYTGLTRVTGGTLGGTGSVLGPVTVEGGGNFAPGEATTTVGVFLLTSQPLTLQGNATFNIRKNAGVPENTRAAGISTASYGGTLTISNLTTEPLVIGDQFQLFSATTGTGNFTTIVGSPGSGLGYEFNPANGILSIVTGVADNPTNLSYSVSGSALTLTWPASHLGWILQGQTNSLSVGIANNWVDVPGSGSTTQAVININPANPTVFFRLKKP